MQIWVDGRWSAFLTLFGKVCFDGRVATSKKVLSKNTLWKIYFGKCTWENTPKIECFWNKKYKKMNFKGSAFKKYTLNINIFWKMYFENTLWRIHFENLCEKYTTVGQSLVWRCHFKESVLSSSLCSTEKKLQRKSLSDAFSQKHNTHRRLNGQFFLAKGFFANRLHDSWTNIFKL